MNDYWKQFGKHFRTKKEAGGLVYIEKRGRRLKKRGSEVREINLYKNLLPKKRKKRKKKGLLEF